MQIPESLKPVVRRMPFYRRLRREIDVNALRRLARESSPLNVVIGGGGILYDGWIHTERNVLDITRPSDWEAIFRPDSIDRILSEHVLEHLTEEDGRRAFALCFRFLKPGGLFRIGVPDGYRRDPAYVAEVSPPRDGHLALYNVDTLTASLESVGFRTEPLEFFDAGGTFQRRPWDETEGYIGRSARFNRDEPFKREDIYFTSLIVDARKP